MHVCRGVLIKDRLVLTSASCIDAVGPNPTVVINAIGFFYDNSSTFRGQVSCTQNKKYFLTHARTASLCGKDIVNSLSIALTPVYCVDDLFTKSNGERVWILADL